MWNQEIKEQRECNEISQTKLSERVGISREYLSKIENGKVEINNELKERIEMNLKLLSKDSLNLMIDYVRIRFPTIDYRYIIEKILKIKIDFLLYEDRSFYGYEAQFVYGDITVMISSNDVKGVLLELKGKGCRQFEYLLTAQGRTWYDFFYLAIYSNAVFKRIDLAINDKYGILSVPNLIQKCRDEECISVFHNFRSYGSGELVNSREDNKNEMGNTLYIGSMKSDIYFCIYEKDKEQLVKNGVILEEAEIKNRFEIRLKNERATVAIEELLSERNAESLAFGIIERYIRFVDREEKKRRTDWKINTNWAYFMGEDREPIKLTMEGEPYQLERTIQWVDRQVAPTLKMLLTLDNIKQSEIVQDIMNKTVLTDKHLKIVEQQILMEDIAEVIYYD